MCVKEMEQGGNGLSLCVYVCKREMGKGGNGLSLCVKDGARWKWIIFVCVCVKKRWGASWEWTISVPFFFLNPRAKKI